MFYANILDFMKYDDYTFLEAYSVDDYVIEFNTVECIQVFAGTYTDNEYPEKATIFLKHHLNAAVRGFVDGNRSRFRTIFRDSPLTRLLLEPEVYVEFFINLKRDCSVSVKEFINDCLMNVKESEYLDYANVEIVISTVQDVNAIIENYSMIMSELCIDSWNDDTLTEFEFLKMFIESIFTYHLEDLVDWNRIWHVNRELMGEHNEIPRYMESLTERHPSCMKAHNRIKLLNPDSFL